jgi:hypothetical protein
VTRRRATRWVVGAAAAAVTLTSCATFSTDAARVGDHRLSGDTFQELLSDVAALPGFATFMVGEKSMDSNFTRNMLGRWITAKVVGDELAARGVAITDDIRRSVNDELALTNGALWQEAPQALRDLFVEALSALRTLTAALAPDPETLRQSYDAGISASGFACTRHILVATREEADEVVAELSAGADFATVARARSLDNSSSLNGGIIEPAPGAGCFDLPTFAQSLVTPYVQGALAATVGIPTEPVQSDFGWHIILVRPFDEVALAVSQIAGGDEAQRAVADLLSGAEVEVASKFGRYDAFQGTVVPLGR